MLKKKERLTRADFNRFFSMGKRHNTPSFGLIYHPHKTLHASVVVSKKVARSAVKRNKLRRRIYDIIRNEKQRNGLPGVFIVIARPHAAMLSYDKLKGELTSLIGRIEKTG